MLMFFNCIEDAKLQKNVTQIKQFLKNKSDWQLQT